jgi:hypothetical protein
MNRKRRGCNPRNSLDALEERRFFFDGPAHTASKLVSPLLQIMPLVAERRGAFRSATMFSNSGGLPKNNRRPMPLETKVIRRPTSLQEVAIESAAYAEFGRHLKDFLHEFAFATKRGLALEPLLLEEPPRLAGRFDQGKVCDAFLAATADYLARVNAIQTPAWALEQDRVLDEPWFSEELPTVRLLLLRDTPSAFKDKNVFVFDSALRVA